MVVRDTTGTTDIGTTGIMMSVEPIVEYLIVSLMYVLY